MSVRDNGFVARHYVVLADLDPRVAEAMLGVLGAEQIAAYVEPSTGRTGGYLEVHLPRTPRDRLWVDREHHERAVHLLEDHSGDTDFGAPTASESTVEAGTENEPDTPIDATTAHGVSDADDAWAQLVANFELPAYEPTRTFDAPADFALDDSGPPAPVRRRVIRPAEPSQAPMSSRAEETPTYSGEFDPLSVLDEHFVPPTPPPVPSLRPATRAALAAIVIGFGLVIASNFTDTIPDAVALGVVGMLGGFGSLVYHMRQERPDDDDSDDGAVV